MTASNDRRLVFEGGDIVFYTSHKPSGIFVVHRDVLASASPYFRSLLSELWGRKPQVARSGTAPVFEMDLQLDCQEGFALPVLRVSSGRGG
jgi:hypothetical protein